MIQKVLSLLIAAGVIIGGQNTALAAQDGLSQTMQSTRQALYTSAVQGDISSMQQILQQGYFIDSEDVNGNTLLCESVYNDDYAAFTSLKKVGASVRHSCVNRIPERTIIDFNNGYQAWVNAVNSGEVAYSAAAQTSATGTGALIASSGLSTGAMVGIGVGAAVLVGGGVALALSSGGSSGSKSSPQPIDPCLNVSCGEHGQCSAGTCVCEDGFVGATCSEAKDCGSEYTATCATGYVQDTSLSCQSGMQTLYKCAKADCSAFPIAGACPANAESCTSCQSGADTFFKITQCKKGWNGSDCSTANQCAYSTTSCDAGYEATGEVCWSAGVEYKQCKEKDCSAFSADCGAGYNKVNACLSGTKQYYTCEPKTCPSDYQAGSTCAAGYVQQGELCQSGESSYIKCVPASCTGYVAACETGYTAVSGDACQSGMQTLYKCAKADCSAFPIAGACPANAESCTSCQSGADTFFKITQCKKGWNGSDCSTANQCAYSTTSCDAGYEATGEVCWSAGVEYKQCKEKDCSAFSADCGAGYNKVNACLSGTKQYYTCEPKTCPSDYQAGSTCAAGYVQQGELCQSGESSYIKCVPASCTGYVAACETGYHTVAGDTCLSGTQTLVKCEVNDCSSFTLTSCDESKMTCTSCTNASGTTYKKASCKAGWEGEDCTSAAACTGYEAVCKTGYTAVAGNTCLSGTQTLVKCAANACEGFTAGACPANAESCQTCQRGDTGTYKIDKCKAGWEGDDCAQAFVCSGYPLSACPSDATCADTCRSGDTDKYKITSCQKENYAPASDGLSCVLHCPANSYASNGSCSACPSGASSPENSSSINDCTCPSGYKIVDGACKQYDFPNLEKHPTSAKTAAEFAALPEFTNGHFLGQIKAQYAYERGHTGFVAATASDGSVSNSDQKVKVGVMDNYLDVNNPDLTDALTKRSVNGKMTAVGFNFDYGPCRGNDRTNCYALVKNEEKSAEFNQDIYDIAFYKSATEYELIYNAENDKDYDRTDYSSLFNAVFSSYASNYDWDNDATKYNVGSTSNYDYDSDLNASSSDHGSHVSGIVAALNNGAGMMGVVPNAELFFTQATGVVNSYADLDGKWFSDAMQNYADLGVKVVNMSFGSSKVASADMANQSAYDLFGYYEVKGMEIAAKNNIVVVRSAGNDGNQKQALIEAAYNLTTTFNGSGEYDLTNLNISVAAVDKNDKLASYSQICGVTKAFCMVAPGGDLDRAIYTFKNSSEYIEKEKVIDQMVTTLEAYLEAYQNETDEAKKEEALEKYKDYYNEYSVAFNDFNSWAKTAVVPYYKEWGIYSTVKADSSHTLESDGAAYGYMQGTSMAAPVVTGAVGLLMSAYPYLTSQQIVEILFRSANKNLLGWGTEVYNEVDDITVKDTLGTWTDSFGNTYQISSIYGHGEVDLKAATEPLGAVTVPVNGVLNKQSVLNAKLALPLALNAKMASALPQTVMGLDDYNRPFAKSIEGLVYRARRNTALFKRDFKSFIAPKTVSYAGVPDKLSFAFSSSQTDKNLLGLGTLDMTYHFNSTNKLSFSYRSDVLAEKSFSEKALANPFVDMTNSYALGYDFKLNPDVNLGFSASTGKNAFYKTDADVDDEFTRSVQAFDMSVGYRLFDAVRFKAVNGFLREKDALLGINGSGIFETNNSLSYYTGATVEYNPIAPVTLSAAYYYGQSKMPKTSSSLVQFDNVVSDSFAFDAKYQANASDVLGFQFSSPLRIKQGYASFNLPVARDLYSDTIYYDKTKVSLKPEARELDFAMYYLTGSADLDWRVELMMRLHPDHNADSAPDYRALFGLSWRY